jgi:hypothetical protein
MIDAALQRVLRQLAQRTETMASDACNDGRLFGLRGVPDWLNESRQVSANDFQWERRITDEIAKRCSDFIEPEQPRYPQEAISTFNGLPRGRHRRSGDLLISLGDGIPSLFVECKSIFECVLKKKRIDADGRCWIERVITHRAQPSGGDMETYQGNAMGHGQQSRRRFLGDMSKITANRRQESPPINPRLEELIGPGAAIVACRQANGLRPDQS